MPDQTVYDDFQKFYDSLKLADEVTTFSEGNTSPIQYTTSGTNVGTEGVGPSQEGQGVGSTLMNLDTDIWLGQTVGTLALRYQPPPAEVVLGTMDHLIQQLSPKSVEDLFQMVVVTSPFSTEYREEWCHRLDRIEKAVYESPLRTDLKPEFRVTKTVQLYVNLIRAQRLAELGEYNAAGAILNELCDDDKWSEVEPDRHTNVLFHLFVHQVCTDNWEDALDTLRRMWSEIKVMSGTTRYNSMAWDDWFAVHLIMWFFATYVNAFHVQLSAALTLSMHAIAGGRKRIIMRAMQPKDIAALVGSHYYEFARSLHPELPAAQDAG